MAKRGVKPNLERRAQMARMRASGMTLQAIGDSFTPPVSREAVRQMVAKHLLDVQGKKAYK